MTAILRLESRRLARSSLVLTGLLALLVAFVLAVFPGFADEAELIEEAFPPVLLGLLGIEQIHTIEGFVGGYVFSIVWLLFAGIYVAYVSAGLIVDDIRTRRMDLTLANPVSRESVLFQKVAALWVPLVALHVGLFAVVYAGVGVVGETLDPVALAIAHLAIVPYLLVCAGIGIVLSVVTERVETAQATALVVVFVLWLVDGLSHMDADFEWVGAIAPSRYVDPGAVLIHDEYAVVDAGILLAAFLVLLAVATAIFVRRDI